MSGYCARAHILVEENIAQPILLGDEKVIQAKANDLSVALDKIKVVNPRAWPKRRRVRPGLIRIKAKTRCDTLGST